MKLHGVNPYKAQIMTNIPLIVDSHCHLDFPDFEGELPNIVQRAKDAGVARMVTICTKLKN